MSKPREDWWPQVRGAIRAYPARKQRLRELRRTPVTPQRGCGGASGGVSDPVGAAVSRTLPERQQAELEAVEWALEITARLPDGAQRLKVLTLYHFRRTHSLYGAAMEAGYSEPTAKRINGDFIYLVGGKLGYRSS